MWLQESHELSRKRCRSTLVPHTGPLLKFILVFIQWKRIFSREFGPLFPPLPLLLSLCLFILYISFICFFVVRFIAQRSSDGLDFVRFGIILWEIMTRAELFPGVSQREIRVMVSIPFFNDLMVIFSLILKNKNKYVFSTWTRNDHRFPLVLTPVLSIWWGIAGIMHRRGARAVNASYKDFVF